jgi:2-polyprenyl-3-methyl-5-hydroxy-6-metoxy-1,4-benzoquinol methylase
MINLFNDSIKKSLIDGYNRHAVYFSSSRYRAWVEIDQTVDLLPRKANILDLGCGNGRLLLSLPKDCKYLGVDFSEKLIEEARKLHHDKEFIADDLTSNELWEQLKTYDAIYMVASLHHVQQKDVNDVFKNCHKHLKDNGLLVVTTWNLLQYRMWGYHINSLWGKLTNGIRCVWVGFRDDFSRFHLTFDKKYLQDFAHMNGFSTIKCDYVTRGHKSDWYHGENLILIAKKIPQSK